MIPDRWSEIEVLYNAVRERGREALDDADPVLRAEVESLLDREDLSSQLPPTKTMALRIALGTSIGSYRLEAPLGEGGMGVVYRAHDTRLNRSVAIKFLSEGVADAAARRRFQREAQMASSLNHPHILTVHDAGELDGRQYLVTEFLDGGTWGEWLKRERRTWRQVIEKLIGVADGLATAHSANILHRDIKPANILLASNGYAKLADFGLAKLAAEESPDPERTLTAGATLPGLVIGTIPYMSPEQASGQRLDARSDIFSFGSVLYESLAGKPPFGKKSDLAVLKTVIHGQSEALPAELPASVRNVVEKALEKDPAERYQSMRDMVVDLRRLSRQVQVQTPEAPPPTQVSRWRRMAMPAGAVVLAAIAGWFAAPRATLIENPLSGAKLTRLTDFPGAERNAIISPDGKFFTFVSDRDGPFDAFVSQIGSGRFTNLTQGKVPNLTAQLLDPPSVGFTGDGSEIWLHEFNPLVPILKVPLLGGPLKPFLLKGPGQRPGLYVAWSPGGSRIVYHTADDGDPTFVADATGGGAHQIYITPNAGLHSHQQAWSTDGRWIYFVQGLPTAAQSDLWRISPDGGMPERMTTHETRVGSPAPIDANTVLYVAQDTDSSGPFLWSLDVPSKTSRRVSFGLEKYTSVAASADGRRLVATVSNPTAGLWTVPILDGRIATEVDAKPMQLPTVRALAPRFQGPTLFYLSSMGTGDGLWRFLDKQSVESWKGSEGALLEPTAISPDGRLAAIILRRNGKVQIYSITTEGSQLLPLAETLEVNGAPAWSPDGKWIVVGGANSKGESGLYKLPAEGGLPVRLVAGFASNPVWSPDGELIVYQGARVGAYAPLLGIRPDGRPVNLPPVGPMIEGQRMRFLPDGRLVYMSGVAREDQNFWLLDLVTGKPRKLTELVSSSNTQSFDITPDGKSIVVDRLRENSDIVMVELDRPANK
ncbi:MAG: protein kinase [Acidobacteriota bacterium]